jgi:hypothetical protein
MLKWIDTVKFSCGLYLRKYTTCMFNLYLCFYSWCCVFKDFRDNWIIQVMPDALVFYFYKKELKHMRWSLYYIMLVHLNFHLLLPRGCRQQFPSKRWHLSKQLQENLSQKAIAFVLPTFHTFVAIQVFWEFIQLIGFFYFFSECWVLSPAQNKFIFAITRGVRKVNC